MNSAIGLSLVFLAFFRSLLPVGEDIAHVYTSPLCICLETSSLVHHSYVESRNPHASETECEPLQLHFSYM
jgi:broad specificity phosphatase PhoE